MLLSVILLLASVVTAADGVPIHYEVKGKGEPEFWAAVRSLPRRQAQVVALFYLEDRAIADVAAILDMSPGTVKRHLHDGRRKLARRLQEEDAQ